MIFWQETRSGVVAAVVGIGVKTIVVLVADAFVGTGELVACRTGRAVEGMMEVSCDEVEFETEDDAVGETVTLVGLVTATKVTVTYTYS